MILHTNCPVCGRSVSVTKEFKFCGVTTKTYTCGHTQTKKDLKAGDLELVSSDNKRPFKYQIDGAMFGIKSGARCLVLDEMGLGKTIQAQLIAHSDPLSFTPVLCIVKSGLRMQWMKEWVRWCGLEWLPQIIESEQDYILPMKVYIVSFDLLRRFSDLEAWILKLGIKLIIIDEVQAIKNHDSKRTNAVRKLTKNVNHIVGLSGTPIKNHGLEYFPILNIIAPDKFNSLNGFTRDWVESYWDGHKYKTGGLKNPDRFKEYTKDFIIRRTRKEVMPDLPVVSRNPMFTDLGSEVEDAYKNTFQEFKKYYNNGSGDSAFKRQSTLLAYLTKMRHLTGIAKVQPCVEFLEDFIDETDRKIVIFVHHKDVAGMLYAQLKQLQLANSDSWGLDILMLSADLNSEQRQEIVDRFWGDNVRIMIASTLAAGEGLNLQCASDCIMLERQWNPANEEQAEGRFIRIGQLADKVTATYMVAVGTIDEFFTELVERKRALVANALDNAGMHWDESSLISELAEVLAQKGGKKWGW